MKLTLTLIAASLLIRFTTPGPGSFWLMSTQDGLLWQVEMSEYVDLPSEVIYRVPTTETHQIFAVQWEGD